MFSLISVVTESSVSGSGTAPSMRQSGAVVSRRELWDHLYDERSDAISNVLDVLVSRLRRKLGLSEIAWEETLAKIQALAANPL